MKLNYSKLTRGGIAFFTLLIFTTSLQAQDPLRKHSIGLSQTFVDYNVQLLNKELFVFDSSLSNFTRFSYQYNLSNWWMVNTGITNGFIDNQHIKEQFLQRAFVVGWDAALMLKLNNGKILKENPLLAPYLTFGYRFDYVNKLKEFDEAPLITSNQFGAGVNLRITPRTHLQLQTAVNQKLAGDFNTHIQYRFGLTQSIGRSQAERNEPNGHEYDLLISEHITTIEDQQKRIDSLSEANLDLKNKQSAESSDTIVVVKESTDLKIKYDELLLAYNDLKEEREKSAKPIKNEITKVEGEKAETKVGAGNSKEAKEEVSTTGKHYHIIVMSSKNLLKAEKVAKDLQSTYSSVTLLPQPNGYFRVSIFASKSKEVALEQLQKVVNEDGRSAWLSHE